MWFEFKVNVFVFSNLKNKTTNTPKLIFIKVKVGREIALNDGDPCFACLQGQEWICFAHVSVTPPFPITQR